MAVNGDQPILLLNYSPGRDGVRFALILCTDKALRADEYVAAGHSINWACHQTCLWVYYRGRKRKWDATPCPRERKERDRQTARVSERALMGEGSRLLPNSYMNWTTSETNHCFYRHIQCVQQELFTTKWKFVDLIILMLYVCFYQHIHVVCLFALNRNCSLKIYKIK